MFRLEKDKDKAILTIYGYVGGAYLDARSIANTLHEIQNSNCKKIDFWLHTYGGDVFEGNMIKVFMEQFIANGGDINIYCPGVLASMGTIIMLSASKVYLVNNGFIMIHAPSGGAYGSAKKMEQTSKLLRNIEKNLINEFEKSGILQEQAKEWMDGNDYWFSAQEALQMGLIDGIIDPIGETIDEIDKDMAKELGAEAIFNKYTAFSNKIQKKKTDMDKQTLIERFGLTTVTEASTDEDVLKAVEAEMSKQNAKTEKLEAEIKAQKTKSIEIVVDNAIKSGKINAEKRTEYIERGNKIGLDELNAIFKDMRSYDPVIDKIKGKNDNGADTKEWDWEKWQKEDPQGLELLAKNNKEAFNALYKKEFGCLPS